MKVVGVAPKFDDATEYSFKWYIETRDKTKDKYTLKELLKNDAVRSKFEQLIKTYDLDILLFYDHGDENGLIQQNGGYLLDKNNVQLIKNKIIYTMACLSAKKLGVEAWKIGCVYVGYTDLFYFTTQDESLFNEAASHGFILYIDGETNWSEIKKKMIEKFNEAIEQTGDPWTKMWLRHDRDCLAIYNGEVPTTSCTLRKIALKLFGEKGWHLKKAIREIF